MVEATDLDVALDAIPEHWVRLGWAGGAKAADAQHSGFLLTVIPAAEQGPFTSPQEAGKSVGQKAQVEHRDMALGEWLRSTAVAIGTDIDGLVRISRQRVLQYIANRKGGVHFDPTRKLHLPDARKRRKVTEDHLLDHGLLRVGHLSGPEYEVAAMTHAIASRPWADDLVREGHQQAPPDFYGDPSEIKVWTGMREPDGTRWATMTFNRDADE